MLTNVDGELHLSDEFVRTNMLGPGDTFTLTTGPNGEHVLKLTRANEFSNISDRRQDKCRSKIYNIYRRTRKAATPL